MTDLPTCLPTCLKRGQPARLFPAVADTNRENRLTSIFLALITRVPDLAKELFGTIGIPISKRTRIRSWTEVVPAGGEHLDKRPDGLIEIATGSRSIRVLVEAKIKGNQINDDQVTRYIHAARASDIEVVLTISNQFVSRADQSPISVSKVLLRKVGLYHWSWTSIRTACDILHYQKAIQDPGQAFLLDEFRHLLEHKDTGVERFSSMGRDWGDLVGSVSRGGRPKRTDPMIGSVVDCWIQEERDLALQIARHIGQKVDIVIGRKFLNDADSRRKAMSARLAGDFVLSSTLRIPDTASDVDITADLKRRTICYSMKLKANLDRQSTKARTNWLLKMLPKDKDKDKDDDRLSIRALWPGRTAPTQKKIKNVRENPSVLQADNPSAAPHGFEVLLVDEAGGDFSGTRKFIERLEHGAERFYDLVAQNLKEWQPSPPKPVRRPEEPDPGKAGPIAGTEDGPGEA